MSVDYIIHRKKKILEADYSLCETKEDFYKKIDELTEEVAASTNQVRVLTDVTFANVGNDFLSRAKTKSKPLQHKVHKSAILGVTGFKKLILNAYTKYTGSKMKAFTSRKEALDYLATD